MRIDLSGKTAVITGSTDGIGFAIAQGLHMANATVVVNGFRAEQVNEAVGKLTGSRGVVADLSTPEDVASS